MFDVAADDRAGQRGVAVASALSSAAVSSGRSVGGRVVGARPRQQDLHGLGDEGDQVVGAVREPRVVERAPVLGHPHRAAAEVGDQLLGDGSRSSAPAVTPNTQPASRAQVDVGAGEGHRRVHGDQCGADGGGRLEHGQAVPAGGVHDVLARPDRAGGAEHRDHVGEHVVGHGQQQQVAGRGRRRSACRRARRAAASSMRVREASDSPATATISWPAARSAAREDGADAAGADDARPGGVRHAHANLSFQSRRPPSIEGRCGYRTVCSSVVHPVQRRMYADASRLGTDAAT